MVDYSKMSDFEINSAVSMAMRIHSASPESKYVVINDYCNNPADAWPIIAESKITMLACDDLWIACPSGSVIDGDTSESQSLMYVNSWSKCPCMSDINPLRAAMIVFLMMQEKRE